MALPLIAAGLVARAAAKKLASRAAGGIVGAGAKSVNPVYKNIGSNVKVVPSKTAPKTGLENRGAKLNSMEQKQRAGDLKWDKQEKSYEASIDQMAAGMKGPKMGPPSTGGKASVKKDKAISKQASKKLPIKINSALPKRGK
jgi:hypothetical protein